MRYFLDLARNDDVLRDFTGIDLVDGDVYKLRELIAEIIKNDEMGRYAGWKMIVHDLNGRTVIVIDLDDLQKI